MATPKGILDVVRPESNRVRVIARTKNFQRKLFQVQFYFGAKGFQLFVQPYLQGSPPGLLSKATHPPDTTVVDLLPGGKTTTKLVKYSHPLDGKAHFSQGVYSVIGNDSKRLDDPNAGQIFTAMCFNLKSFQEVTTSRQPAHDLNLDMNEERAESEMITLTGWWYHSSRIRQPKGKMGPKIALEIGGKPTEGVVLAPNTEDPFLHQCALILTFNLHKPAEDPADFSLLCGMDPVMDSNQDFQFLSMNYPAHDYEETRRKVGSIDYDPTQPSPFIE